MAHRFGLSLRMLFACALVSVFYAACSGTPGPSGDAGNPGSTGDSGVPGGSDAGNTDSGVLGDAGPSDGGTADSGTVDSGAVDSGSADSGTPDGGHADAGGSDAGTADSGQPDSGFDGGVDCNSTADCTGGQYCCVDLAEETLSCKATCPTQSQFNCVSPAQCGGGEICCATLILDGGPLTGCNMVTAGSRCELQSSCPYTFAQLGGTCHGIDQSNLCTKPGDCTQTGFKCCSFSASAIDAGSADSGFSVLFCAGPLVQLSADWCM